MLTIELQAWETYRLLSGENYSKSQRPYKLGNVPGLFIFNNPTSIGEMSEMAIVGCPRPPFACDLLPPDVVITRPISAAAPAPRLPAGILFWQEHQRHFKSHLKLDFPFSLMPFNTC